MRLKTKQEIVDLINSSELDITNLHYVCSTPTLITALVTHPLYHYDENDEDLNYGEVEEIVRGDMEKVYEQSYGDGNLLEVTILIKPYNLYISFEGTDSSYADVWFKKCYISVPYEHTETRYKKAEQ